MNSKKLLQGLLILPMFLLPHIVTLGQAPVIEPYKINFTSFTIHSNHKKIMIDWATDNKVATNYFEIQKSRDGVNFNTIELVLGADPKQASCDCYEGFDKADSNSKKYFYRLKHVSTDGEVELSKTKMLAINK